MLPAFSRSSPVDGSTSAETASSISEYSTTLAPWPPLALHMTPTASVARALPHTCLRVQGLESSVDHVILLSCNRLRVQGLESSVDHVILLSCTRFRSRV